MKKINRLLLLSALLLPLFSGCEFLQGTLSSAQEEKLAQETGRPSYSYKTWYYNGTSAEDMTKVSDSEFYAESLKIDFGKKVAVGTLHGSISVSYKDSMGNSHTDVTREIRGRLSPDFESFYLDMSYVINHFDAEQVTSGTASVDIKLSGFVCAEGRQTGRSLEAFEISKLQVKPLFNKTDFIFSTIGFDGAKFAVPLNAEVDLEHETVTGLDALRNEYDFDLAAEGKTLYLTPKFAKPDDGTFVTVPLAGIIPQGCGSAYEKELTASFVKNLIVIDGLMDENYSSGYAVSTADAEGDSCTDGYDGASDLQGMYVSSDEDYLYVALTGALTVDWYDGLVLMVSKDHNLDASDAAGSGKENFGFADTKAYGRDTLKHGKPDYYLFDRIYSGTTKAWVGNTTASSVEEVSANVLSSGITDGSFIEYAIPLSDLAKAGIVSGDTVHIIGGFSAHWDDGVYLSDAVPDEAVSFNASHSSATVNFQKGLEFTLN